MKINNDFFYKILNSLFEGVYICDRDRKITFWNKSAEKITGYKTSEVMNKHCWEGGLKHIDENGRLLCNTNSCPLLKTIIKARPVEMESYFRHYEGYRVHVLIRTLPMRDSKGQVTGIAEIFQDKSPEIQTRQKIKELERLALIDPVTGLGNRRYIEIELTAALNEVKKDNWSFGVLFIDIDYFKNVNDKYGHNVGDKLLKMVAKTMSKNLRSLDSLGRWSGDEFVAIVVAINEQQLYRIANKLRLLVERSSLFSNNDTIRATISIGGTILRDNDTLAKVIKRADKLMYKSKISGRNCVSIQSKNSKNILRRIPKYKGV